MDVNTTRNDKKVFGLDLAALLLGIGSVVALAVSILLGILVESIGIASFDSLIISSGLAAFICGLVAERRYSKRNRLTSVQRRSD